ncbi:hypothetical protein Purlil1_5843 [Purpureocillium lilacinum]|uniref:Uncharacterized protein n=1 Tax=Purpureocillium lilacinum TaxID=33203 RepID=A0ABR0C0L3_PURLI|nr:hypothetical protein Purlil1_5843 [Purpureocillium lilacinum]
MGRGHLGAKEDPGYIRSIERKHTVAPFAAAVSSLTTPYYITLRRLGISSRAQPRTWAALLVVLGPGHALVTPHQGSSCAAVRRAHPRSTDFSSEPHTTRAGALPCAVLLHGACCGAFLITTCEVRRGNGGGSGGGGGGGSSHEAEQSKSPPPRSRFLPKNTAAPAWHKRPSEPPPPAGRAEVENVLICCQLGLWGGSSFPPVVRHV